jgi:CHAT domain-containing protein/ketosteroid isomerase-like protein
MPGIRFRMRRLLYLVLALTMATSAYAAAEGDDDAIRGVVRQFFAHYAGGDVPALMELWSPSAAGSKAFRIELAAILEVRCLTLGGVAIERIERSGDSAVVDAQAAITKSWLDGSRATSEVRNARLRLQRENGVWRVAAYEAREDELAAQLVAAADERERIRLLGEHPELVTRHLVWRLLRRGNQKINTISGPVSAVQPVADLALFLARQLGDRAGEAMALGLSGIIARLSNDRPAATALTKTSVALAEESGDPDAIARAYLNLSRIAQFEDRFGEGAREYPRRALEFSRQGEEPILRVRILEGVASAEYILENRFEARRYFDEVSRLAQELGDMSAQVTSNWNLAELYLEQGDLDMALYHNDRAVRMAREGKSYFIGFAVMQAGTIRMRRGDLAGAKVLYQEALEIMTAMEDQDGLSLVHHLLAEMKAAEGNFDEAECETRELGKTYAAIGFRAEPALLDLAQMALDGGHYRRAAALGLEHAASRVEIEASTAVKALRIAGTAFRKLGLADRALPTLQEAVQRHDEASEHIAGDEQQDVLAAEQMAAAFADIVDLLAVRGETEEAFRYAEERKGRVLRKILSAKLDLSEGMSAADRERERELQRRIAELNRERDRVSAGEAPDPLRLAQLDRDLADAHRGYRSFRDSVYVRHPRIQRRRGFVPVLPPRELRARIPAGLVFVEFVVTDERTHAFILGRDTFAARSIAITREELDRKIASFATKLAGRELAFRQDARELFALLLAPLQDDLGGAEAICIVPDGSLWRLPFGALVDAKNRYVVERLSVSYAPSISIYMSVGGGDDGRRDTLLSLADPRLSPHIRTDFASFYRASEPGALPHAAREADALRRLYGDAHSAVFTGSSATESLAKARAGRYRIVHFATHAMLDDRNPMHSRLLLAQDRGTPEDDGYLEAWEIARLELDADLVVLSACDTALGKIGGGEGVIGMTWALFVAGARATVASQWKVSSASTAELMIAFHRNLLAAAPASSSRKADALRRAQLELIRDSRYAHPFYWSAFVLVGDAR